MKRVARKRQCAVIEDKYDVADVRRKDSGYPACEAPPLAIFSRDANIGGKGAQLRWAARADDEPTATEGGDPSGT